MNVVDAGTRFRTPRPRRQRQRPEPVGCNGAGSAYCTIRWLMRPSARRRPRSGQTPDRKRIKLLLPDGMSTGMLLRPMRSSLAWIQAQEWQNHRTHGARARGAGGGGGEEPGVAPPPLRLRVLILRHQIHTPRLFKGAPRAWPRTAPQEPAWSDLLEQHAVDKLDRLATHCPSRFHPRSRRETGLKVGFRRC